MSKHSMLSPSGWKRWSNCPASLKEVEHARLLKLDDSSPYAAEGTQAHDYGEQVLKGKLALDDVPEDFHDGVALYINSIRADLEFGGEILGIEKRLKWTTDVRVGGTPDCVHRVRNCIVIPDFKYGAGEYVSADSMQLQIYGFLAARKYGKKTDTQIELRVVQPRYERDGLEKIRSTFWDRKELDERVAQFLLDAIEQIETSPDLRKSGDHCKWCPASRLPGMPPCPEHVKQFTDLLATVPLDKPSDLATLSETERLKKILDSEPLILGLLKHAKAVAHEKLYKGETIEGYTLEEHFGNRQWSQSDESTATELRALGLTWSQVWVEKVVSPAQAEKAGLKGQIDHLTTKESKGLVLTPDKKLVKDLKYSAKKLLAANPLKGDVG